MRDIFCSQHSRSQAFRIARRESERKRERREREREREREIREREGAVASPRPTQQRRRRLLLQQRRRRRRRGLLQQRRRRGLLEQQRRPRSSQHRASIHSQRRRPRLELAAAATSQRRRPKLGKRNEDFSVNFGMGVGLVFLLAKSATEFNKMTELRAEMEMLLKEIKHEVRRKDDIASSSESNTNISFSPSHCCRGIDTSKITSMPNCGACFSLQEAKCDAESDSGSKYATAFANERSLSIGQMEEELEVELERLQHNLEGQGSSVLQHRMEVDCENNDPSIESFSLNCEEEEDVPKDANHKYHGVSARELERKLHELLEMRQQEKIAELESAFECAKQKLREKEMELQWWKETQWVASLNQDKAFV